MLRPCKQMLVIAVAAALLAVLAGMAPAAASTRGATAPVNFSVPNAPPVCPNGVAYVNHAATGTNTGVSWANAFTNLQSALNSTCGTFSEIWVAQGLYKPGLTVLNTFTIHPGMSLYGGFAGIEATRDERNWAANVTVLSGDVDSNDITDANGVVTTATNIQLDNAYHVVWMDGKTGAMDSLTHLDGVVITGGKGSGADIDAGTGGGVYCEGWGGGNCSPTIANVTFSGNQSGRGGGMYNDGESGTASPTLTNVTFTGNAATADGGGLYNGGSNGGMSSPTLSNVTFTGNQAGGAGGAIVNQGSPAGESSLSLTNGLFTYNSAGLEGGALYNNAGGGGTSSPTLTNVTFYGNTSATRGGAIYNISTNAGQGLETLANAILWGNTATQGDAQIGDNATTSTVNYSVVQGGWAGAGSSTTAADPLFADAANGNLNLLPGSPAIDSGTAAGAPATDIRDLSRPVNSLYDMGAYEVRGFDLSITGGTPQTTTTGTAFGTPLGVQVASSHDELVGPGGLIVFTPPASGPGLSSSTPFTVTTDASGAAGTPATTNVLSGSYQVGASTRGAAAPVNFNLTNAGIPMTITVNSAPNPSVILAQVTFTATVDVVSASSTTQNALVTFYANGQQIGSGGLANKTATVTTGTLPAGSNVITATYAGDNTHLPSTSAPYIQVVQPLPVAVNDAAGTLQDAPVTLAVLANDYDPVNGGLTVSAITLIPAHGTAQPTGDRKAVLYIPDAGFSGLDSFVYVARDANGHTDDALATVVVTPIAWVPWPPQITPVDPLVAVTSPFTSPNANVEVQLPAGFVTETVPEKSILFLSYTPVLTPTGETSSPPANLTYGNFEFDLTLFLDNEPQHGVQFATPITATIAYSPTILGGLKEETLGVYHWGGSSWSTAGIIIMERDLLHHRITIALAHLSEFAFFAQKEPTALDPGDEPRRNTRLFLPGVMR
ncbi:MAG: choice-of-anchor Q domain-containing protein [Caldilineaceae bacterium]